MSTITKTRPDIEIGQLVDRFMRQVHCDLGRKAPTFDKEKVGPAGGLLLMTLAEAEPVAIHDLVRKISRDKAQVTRLLQSLERKGLIMKRPSVLDRRVFVLNLTPDGQKTVATLRFALSETIDGVLEPLSGHERDTLKSLLQKAVGPSK